MVPRRVRAASLSADATKTLIGTSPYPGDVGYLGVLVPPMPSTSYQTRHLLRLCTVGIPEGMVGRVLAVGQLLTIGGCVPAAEVEEQRQRVSPCDNPAIRFERPIITPWWSFQDGNASWHLMAYQGDVVQALLPNTLGVPAQDNNLYGVDSAVLVNVFSPPGVYAPLNQGVPPGVGMGSLGLWHSIDYPWPGRDIDMAFQPEWRGPCTIGLFVSIYQTDPSHRLIPATGAGIEQVTIGDGLVPEDEFVLAYPDTARYWRAAGALEVELRCQERGAKSIDVSR